MALPMMLFRQCVSASLHLLDFQAIDINIHWGGIFHCHYNLYYTLHKLFKLCFMRSLLYKLFTRMY